MEHRDRANGWQHAKLSGHKNEDLVKNLLDVNENFQNSFLSRVNRSSARITYTSIGGLHETNVPSVNDRKTKSKTDLKVFLDNNEMVNVSIKKSLHGQVYFIRAGLFIDTFEKQFGVTIPSEVQRAINLFWSAADDAVTIIEEFADKSNSKNYYLQLRHRSLNATTLKTYDEHLYNIMLAWFADNAYELSKLSFSMGAVHDRSEWSDYIWYINLLGENDTDDLFLIEDVCHAARDAAHTETYYGTYYGGTTIQLPFGFVQWHQGKMQFHHDYNKLKNLLR
jgi:hypothetical protein